MLTPPRVLVFVYIVILVAVFLIASCSNVQQIRPVPTIQPKVTEVVYDGCTYLILEGGITHKGNCPNPVHKK